MNETPILVISACVRAAAARLGLEVREEGDRLWIRSYGGWQEWRADGGWERGVTCAIAARAEEWVLKRPSVRVEIVDGLAVVVEGCRRFNVERCAEEWHEVADAPCNGHPVISRPDPFPLERFVQGVLAERVVCAYVDGLLDPEEWPERRWGGFVWLPRESAQVLEEWQGWTSHPLLDARSEEGSRASANLAQ